MQIFFCKGGKLQLTAVGVAVLFIRTSKNHLAAERITLPSNFVKVGPQSLSDGNQCSRPHQMQQVVQNWNWDAAKSTALWMAGWRFFDNRWQNLLWREADAADIAEVGEVTWRIHLLLTSFQDSWYLCHTSQGCAIKRAIYTDFASSRVTHRHIIRDALLYQFWSSALFPLFWIFGRKYTLDYTLNMPFTKWDIF